MNEEKNKAKNNETLNKNIMEKEIYYINSNDIEKPFDVKRQKTTIRRLLNMCRNPTRNVMHAEYYK